MVDCAASVAPFGSLLAILMFLLPVAGIASSVTGPRTGAAVCNLAPPCGGGASLATIGLGVAKPAGIGARRTRIDRVAVDRRPGNGLTPASGFGYTHLGRRGRGQNSES